MNALDPGLIVALTGAVATAGGLVTARRGRQDSRRQAAVADVLNHREQQWQEMQDTNTRLAAENVRLATRADAADADRDHYREQSDANRARAAAAEERDRIRDALIAQHEMWDAARRSADSTIPQPPPLRLPRQRGAVD